MFMVLRSARALLVCLGLRYLAHGRQGKGRRLRSRRNYGLFAVYRLRDRVAIVNVARRDSLEADVLYQDAVDLRGLFVLFLGLVMALGCRARRCRAVVVRR